MKAFQWKAFGHSVGNSTPFVLAIVVSLQVCVPVSMTKALSAPFSSECCCFFASPRFLLQRRHDSIRFLKMTAAPKGSFWETQCNKVFENPLENLPWESQIPFFKAVKKDADDNWWFNFIKSEWSYLNHKADARRPAGVIEGGIENYDGMGLLLPNGVDRQRSQNFSRVMDHGVEWRQNMAGPVIKFDLHPDGNQDVFFGESDVSREERQWGSWGSQTATEYMLETGWREPLLEWDIVGMPYPWTHKLSDVQEVPLVERNPAANVPHPLMDWELAAYGLLGDLHTDYESDYRYAYNLEKESLELLEKELQDFEHLSKDQQKKKSFSFLPKALMEDAKKLDKQLLAAILMRTRDILRLQLADKRKDPEWQLRIIDRVETPDHMGGGEWNCTDAEIEDKTIAFNNAIFSNKPVANSYLEKLSKAEMAEMYHYFMTEMRREGRFRDYAEAIAQDNDVDYEIRWKREHFPALISLYKPLWNIDQFGDEFGDALREEETLDKRSLLRFGQPLKTLTKTTKRETHLNYLNEYKVPPNALNE